MLWRYKSDSILHIIFIVSIFHIRLNFIIRNLIHIDAHPPLQRFFGMMRGACDFNNHPDSVLFAQVFRLMSTYSLVKPPRRCNVSGSEMLSTLLSSQEINNNSEQLAL